MFPYIVVYLRLLYNKIFYFFSASQKAASYQYLRAALKEVAMEDVFSEWLDEFEKALGEANRNKGEQMVRYIGATYPKRHNNYCLIHNYEER
jgi:hypothetical protein